MGIGRWGLVRELGPVLPLLARLSKATVMARGDLFLHWGAGFALRKPEGWAYHWPEDPDRAWGKQLFCYHELPEQVAISDVIDWDSTYYPLVTGFNPHRVREIVGSGASDLDRLGPSFAVHYEAIKGEDEAAVPLPDYVERDIDAATQVLADFQMLTHLRLAQISACESVEYTAQWFFAHENVPEWMPLRERVLYVSGRWAIFSVRMFDYPEFGEEMIHDFDPFVKTLRFA